MTVISQQPINLIKLQQANAPLYLFLDLRFNFPSCNEIKLKSLYNQSKETKIILIKSNGTSHVCPWIKNSKEIITYFKISNV